MSYQIKITPEQKVLRVEVAGKADPGREAEDAIQVWRQVEKKCREEGYIKILSIWNVEGHLSTFAAFSIAEAPSKYNWSRQYKIAVVQKYAERYEDSLFAETVAGNRGYKLKIFKHEQDAQDWLESSTSPE